LVKKNAASMGDSNLSGFVWIEMMKQFDKLPRSLGAGDTMTREELAAAIEDAVGAPIIWEGTDTSNKPQIAEGILDKIMDKIRRAKGKFKKIKLGRKAKTNMESKENVNERKYTEKDILIQKAVGIALKMGGNMTGAYKKIESMKRGLGDNPIVKQALRLANESVDEKSKGKPLTPLQRKTVMKLYKDVAKGGPDATKAMQKLRVILDVPVNESLQENVKAVMRKHKKHIDKWKRSNKPMPIQVEDELMQAAMKAGEIKTDDPDEFDDWLDRNV
jgi:gas vesicle protein